MKFPDFYPVFVTFYNAVFDFCWITLSTRGGWRNTRAFGKKGARNNCIGLTQGFNSNAKVKMAFVVPKLLNRDLEQVEGKAQSQMIQFSIKKLFRVNEIIKGNNWNKVNFVFVHILKRWVYLHKGQFDWFTPIFFHASASPFDQLLQLDNKTIDEIYFMHDLICNYKAWKLVNLLQSVSFMHILFGVVMKFLHFVKWDRL